MQKNIYKQKNYNIERTVFGGIIYPSDFNTDYRGKDMSNGSTIAKRIARDWIFDKQCRKKLENSKLTN